MHVFGGYLSCAMDTCHARHHPLCIKPLIAARTMTCPKSQLSPTICRYRTVGWLVERLQGCLSSNSQNGWWALPNDSLHIEALIDWAEKLLDDMGHKSQAQAGKVHWHHSLPLSSIAVSLLLPVCDTATTALALKRCCSGRPMDGPASVHCNSTAKGGCTLTQQLLSLRQLC